MWPTLRWLAPVVLACFAGCARSKPPAAAGGEALAGATVPAGSEVEVRLDEPLGVDITPAGQLFSARLSEPLRTERGRVLVPAGAVVHGVVVSVDREPAPALRLRFDGVESAWGVLPLRATVRAPEPARWESLEVWVPHARYDAALLAPEAPAGPAKAVGGGPTSTAPGARAPSRSSLLLPAGAPLRLVLTAPLGTEPIAP
jgi:hypothetical protein